MGATYPGNHPLRTHTNIRIWRSIPRTRPLLERRSSDLEFLGVESLEPNQDPLSLADLMRQAPESVHGSTTRPTSMKLHDEVGDESPVDVLIREFKVHQLTDWTVRALPNGSGQSVHGDVPEALPVREKALSGMVAARRRPSREASSQEPTHASIQPRAPRLRPSREELELPEPSAPLQIHSAILDADELTWLSADACSTPVTCDGAA